MKMRLSFTICLCFVLLIQNITIAQDKYYLQREQKVSAGLKQRLSSLRTQAASQKWSFSVGYTTAMDKNIQQLTGLREPQNLEQQIQTQKGISDKMLKSVTPSAGDDPKLKTNLSFSLKRWDWRTAKKVSPVRNQGGCGSCWAFATIGAFEGNWRIRNISHIDASEQCILNCSGKGSCGGGWWAFDYLISHGVATEAAYPYTANDKPCNNSIPRPYKAAAWGYVAGNYPSVAQLKAALCKYGPLAVAVHVSPAFQAYTGGVFNNNVNQSVNHGVTLIGWDDNKQAWIIKNSWGTGWGSTADYGTEKGYMYIRYGCSRIGYAAAWVQAKKFTLPTSAQRCWNFNPAKISVKFIRQRWKIVEGSHWIMDFGSKKNEAFKAFSIIKHYKMNRRCIIGKGNKSMEYFLVNGKAPAGAFRGEDAIGFNPGKIQVKFIKNDWKIVDGNSWLLSFGKDKSAAVFAHKTIKRYGFNRLCFVGRPNASMVYFRR